MYVYIHIPCQALSPNTTNYLHMEHSASKDRNKSIPSGMPTSIIVPTEVTVLRLCVRGVECEEKRLYFGI